MNTVRANAHGPMSSTQYHHRTHILSHDTLVIAADGVSVVLLLTLEVATLWVLLSAIYLASWPVQ